ncbi:MAG: ectoine/hydroxyectoine ABC transporter permease subunit EhuD [Bacillaceae bacterium]|nr:ectoine/hydroxyectoine ABC transporter permease subunit EhuD [Bacillaceae bacterium]
MIREWDWSTVIDAFPLIFKAMWITLGMTIACYAFALVFGLVWTFIRRVRIKPLQRLISFIMEFIRTTPPLVQLYFIYYAWPLVPYVGVTLDPITTSILGLGIHFSTYISEIYRSGIESVDKGQWEAATALNFSTRQKWTKIILPQAIPPTIPMLGNYLIIMFKEIPLTAAVGVGGMLLTAQKYGAKFYEYMEPLTLVALFFLLLSYPSSILVQKLEQKMNRRFDKKPGGSNNGKEVTAS